LPIVSLTACGPKPEYDDLEGLWGRVDDGEFQIWEFADQIDATGLVGVVPAFRRWEYQQDSTPREMARGRWNTFGRDLVITPAWSLLADPEDDPDLLLQENTTLMVEVVGFTPVEIELLYPGEEEPRLYTTYGRLPEPTSPE
jgi:hypothetical protein